VHDSGMIMRPRTLLSQMRRIDLWPTKNSISMLWGAVWGTQNRSFPFWFIH